MIKNYLKTALRTLRRNKLFSLINILGLSVGTSAALIIGEGIGFKWFHLALPNTL